MLGMTGYSYKETAFDNLNIIAEIKSVNSRFLDIIVNIPYYLNCIEINIRNLIREKINRGKVEVNVSLKQTDKTYSVNVNMNIAEQYINSFNKLIDNFNLKDEVRLFHLTRFDDIFMVDKDNDFSKYWEPISKVLNENIERILSMKKDEGKALKKDLMANIHNIKENISLIEKNVPTMEKEIFNTMKDKIAELINDKIDEVKLLNEAAFMVNRCCINEEVVRFNSHIDQFIKIIEEEESVGKKLDFVCQEMHREINTIGSKISLVDLTKNVITVKNDIEKIREQLRNIE
ncbi:MAG: YicC family protein [Spirochaetes bacterium]|nr:YicC family protein [Spirochaetota bacterium]